MGCDIHCFVEKKVDGKWTQIGNFFSDWRYPQNLLGELTPQDDSPIDDRNYTLFGALAGVRRETVEPVAQPRGIPSDASHEIMEDYTGWGCDAHTASWLTVKELLAYDWDQPIRMSGLVTEGEFKTYIKQGEPDSWCGGIFGHRTRLVSQDRMMIAVKGAVPFIDPDVTHYCEITWNNKLSDYLGTFLKDSLPQLEGRCEEGDTDDVRIVFWFDN